MGMASCEMGKRLTRVRLDSRRVRRRTSLDIIGHTMIHTITERITFERTRRLATTRDGRFTDAGAALSAGLAAGTLRLEVGRVVCASGHPAQWHEAAAQWGPDYGELDELEKQGFVWTGG
jgi:hypothetical protein